MCQMSKRFGLTIILMVGSLLTIRSVALAQHPITVICNSLEPQTESFSLPGTYFHLIGQPLFSDPNSNYQIEAISASGSQQYILSLPTEADSELHTPIVSPDGRFLVFRPASSEQGLTVWDLRANAITSLPLQSSDIEYLNPPFRSISYQHNQNLLVWQDSHHLLMQYYDGRNRRNDWIIARKVFTIQEMPFAISEGVREELNYPDLPLPQDAILAQTELSPNGRYATGTITQTIYGVPGSQFRLQIYDLQPNPMLVYDFVPTAEIYPVTKPVWMPDSTKMFFLLKTPDRHPRRVVELRANEAFNEDMTLQKALNNTFGVDAGMLSMLPLVSPNGQHIMFSAYAPSNDNKYLLRYTPSTGQIIAVCDPGPGPVSDETYPFWITSEDYFGYYFNNMVYIVGFGNGDHFALLSNHGFVGWIEPDIFAPTSTPEATTNP